MSNKSYTMNVLGFNLPFNGPATADDIDRIVGKAGSCAEAFMQIYCYHQRGPEFRQKFAEALEEHTGIPRKSHEEKNEKTGETRVVYDESEAKYMNALLAGEKLTDEDAQRIALEVNDALGDWTPVSGRTTKPSKAFYELADGVLAKIAAGKTTQEQVIANIEAKLSVSFDATFGEWNRDNIARACKAVDEKRRQEMVSMFD